MGIDICICSNDICVMFHPSADGFSRESSFELAIGLLLDLSEVSLSEKLPGVISFDCGR